MSVIGIKRVYEPVEKSDGERLLVVRPCPRRIKKEALHMTGWLKEVAPSNELRQWFNHDPAKWMEFQKRYVAELDKHHKIWQSLLEAAESDNITLVFSARDTEHTGGSHPRGQSAMARPPL